MLGNSFSLNKIMTLIFKEAEMGDSVKLDLKVSFVILLQIENVGFVTLKSRHVVHFSLTQLHPSRKTENPGEKYAS